MMNWINKKRNRKGFTLVELVVVIAILGILAGIAVPKLSASRENAAIAAHNANVRTLESAATLAVSEGLGEAVWDEKTGNEGAQKWGDYLQTWPVVPTGVAGRTYTVVVPKEGGAEGETVEKTETIAEVYSVKIEESGVITVTPGKITTKLDD